MSMPSGGGTPTPGGPATTGSSIGGATSASDVWSYRDTSFAQGDLTGYKVEARDGGIGKIDDASNEVGSSYVVVDTGPWILGKKVLIPAGVISSVDPDTETVFVDRTKDEIKNAPEYDEERFADAGYRDEFGTYYGSGPGV